MLPTAQFENYRPLMFSIAYRMLGSAADAEDIVQDAYLRYQAVPPETIVSPKAFLSTVVTRLCLNQLESARVKREAYVGPWLPEPVLTEAGEVIAGAPMLNSPAHQAELHESIAVAFLVLLEQLTPVERAVLIASVLLVIIVELLNTSVEAAIDRISFERHSLSKRAKDIGSAAVFLSLVNVVCVWGLVLFG